MKLPRPLDDLVETGRHNLEGLVDGGRKGAQRLYDDGRHNLEGLVDGGRKGAQRIYHDGRHWIGDHLPDARELRRSGRREVERQGGRAQAAGRSAASRAAADDRLRAPVRWIEARLPEPRRSHSVLWPSVLAAAGAGVAFWWWTSWSRGRAEAADREALDAAGGAEGKAHPEQVMAHAPEPAGAPVNAPDASAAKLSEPAEDVMAHAPPPSEAAPATGAGKGGKATADEARLLGSTAASGLAGGVAEVAPAKAVKSLDESLAVQGAASSKGGGTTH